MGSKIRAVLFDLDGVLRDSRDAIWPALEYALEQHGVDVSDREPLRPFAHNLFAVHEEFAAHVPRELFVAAYDKKLDSLRHTMKLYDTADVVIRRLHTQGYRLGLVTSARMGGKTLEDAGLDHLFDAVVGGLDVKERKPHPEPMQLALKKLGLRAGQAVMVGDLPADIQSAKAAKLAVTIGLTDGFGTRQMLEAANPDYIIDSLADLEELLDKIQKA